MTLQVEFWTVVGFLITFMSFVGGMAKWLFSKAEERQAARFASLEQSLQQSASNWGELEKEFMRFKADLPLNYVRREDYIRGQTVIEAKLGKPLALSTIYAMLARHGWRKVAPDKIHPKSDPDAQEDWKKNCRGAWQKKEPDLP